MSGKKSKRLEEGKCKEVETGKWEMPTQMNVSGIG